MIPQKNDVDAHPHQFVHIALMVLCVLEWWSAADSRRLVMGEVSGVVLDHSGLLWASS